MNELFNFVSNFVVAIPFYSFLVCVLIMFISILSIGIDHPTDLPSDFFGISNPLVTAGLSKIPLMIGLTLTFAPMTIMNLILDLFVYNYIREIPLFGFYIYYLIGTIGLFATFIASLFIAGYLARPLERAIHNSNLEVSYEFKTGIVNSEFITDTYGEVKILLNNSDHFLSAVIDTGNENIPYGTSVIVKRKKDENTYIVEKIETNS